MKNVILVLDNLRSAHNVGAIMRSAVAFGCTRFLAVGTTPYPPTTGDQRLPHAQQRARRQINKTALGAEEHATFTYYAEPGECNAALAAMDIPIVVLEQHEHAIPVYECAEEPPFVLVVGNEVNGVSRVFIEAAHTIVEIPCVELKSSLNVASAASIALYQIQTKR